MSNLLLRRRKIAGGGGAEPYALKFTNVGTQSAEICMAYYLSFYGGREFFFYYSFDGITFNRMAYGDPEYVQKLSLLPGQSVYIKGDNPNGLCDDGGVGLGANFPYFAMTSNRQISCEGSVMSLLGEDILTIPQAYCFNQLFYGCNSLVSAPDLPARELTVACYWGMFINTSLVNAPELPATTLAEGCYVQMFYGCTSLNYIKCLAEDLSASNALYLWLSGVSSTGTFVKKAGVSWPSGRSGIPSGWTVEEV